MGNREDGIDSLATQVRPASHWPGMRVLIAVVSELLAKALEGIFCIVSDPLFMFYGLGE